MCNYFLDFVFEGERCSGRTEYNRNAINYDLHNQLNKARLCDRTYAITIMHLHKNTKRFLLHENECTFAWVYLI